MEERSRATARVDRDHFGLIALPLCKQFNAVGGLSWRLLMITPVSRPARSQPRV